MRVSIVRRISIGLILIGLDDCLCNNDGNNESVNSQDTCHDNGNNVFNDSSGMVDTHLANTEASLPGSPGASPTGQNHANGSSKKSTVFRRNE